MVDQALHGYKDGHRLLASSVELSNSDRRLLTRQTDNPDAGRVKGWEGLLIGHPLPSGLYAISLTWPAWEMPRPGCVWTHTLILDKEASAAASVSAVLSLFKRPQGPDEDLSIYRKSLKLEPTPEWRLSSKAKALTSAVIWAYYEPPVRPVRVTRVDLSDTERHLLLLQTWVQGWPELRITMTFADAPRTPRAIDETSFDLQIHQSSRIDQASDEARVLRGIPKAKLPTWVQRLTTDGIARNGLPLFLATYGPERDDRGYLKTLVSIYLEHESDQSRKGSATRVVEEIAHAHLSLSEGRRLKMDILNPKGQPLEFAQRLDEVDLLCALVSYEGDLELDPFDLDVAKRAQDLINRDPHGTEAVISSIIDAEGPLASAFLSGIVESLDSRKLESWSSEHVGAALQLVRKRPEMLHQPEMWRALEPQELWNVAGALRGGKQRALTIKAILAAGSDLDPQLVFSRWRNAGQNVLEALDSSPVPPDQARRWLSQIPPAQLAIHVKGTKEISQELLKLVLEQMSTDDISDLPPKQIASLVTKSSPVELGVAALAAALMRTGDPEWAPIAVSAYECVYEPARRDQLGEVKQKLRKVAGELPEWDVLGRIVKALNRALVNPKWPVLTALSLRDKNAFRGLLEADDAALLARSLLKEATNEQVRIHPWQQEIISEVIVDRSDRDSLIKTLEGLGRAFWKLIR